MRIKTKVLAIFSKSFHYIVLIAEKYEYMSYFQEFLTHDLKIDECTLFQALFT